MEKAPASRPAMPESRMVLLFADAPATPRIRLALDTSPSLMPNTAARRIPPPAILRSRMPNPSAGLRTANAGRARPKRSATGIADSHQADIYAQPSQAVTSSQGKDAE